MGQRDLGTQVLVAKQLHAAEEPVPVVLCKVLGAMHLVVGLERLPSESGGECESREHDHANHSS